MSPWVWIIAGLALGGLWAARTTRGKNFLLDITGDRMNLSIPGMDALKAHEGFLATVYSDQAGLPTIGYGHKLREGESFPDGVDESIATSLLADDIRAAEDAVNADVSATLNQAQFDALVSLVFNIGADAFSNSTLLAKLNAGDFAGAAAEFKRWNKVHVGGELVASAGQTSRRADEERLFSTGQYA